MGTYVEWNGYDETRDFWRGFHRANKAQSNYTRSLAEGRKSVFRDILRCVQIVIVVTASFVILRGCDVLVTLR
jgi:hypothetical protein